MRTKTLATLFAVAALAAAPAARAQYVVTFQQVGSNVVATGAGSFDLAGLTLAATWGATGAFIGCDGLGDCGLLTGTTLSGDEYQGFTGPANFASDILTLASTGTGAGASLISGTELPSSLLAVPSNYLSGTELNNSSTWDGATIASLGLNPGIYVWNWGTDGSFTLDIEAPPVPEPATLPLLATMLGLGAVAHRRRRAK